jgi:hypothetical protein
MTQAPGEPISDGDAPTGDPDLSPGEQPEPATEPSVSPDQQPGQETEVEEGDVAGDPTKPEEDGSNPHTDDNEEATSLAGDEPAPHDPTQVAESREAEEPAGE